MGYGYGVAKQRMMEEVKCKIFNVSFGQKNCMVLQIETERIFTNLN